MFLPKLLTLLACTAALAPAVLADHHETSLKDALGKYFRVGATVGGRHLSVPDHPALKLVTEHFNTLTTGNELIWGVINPQPGEYRFDIPDRFVAFTKKHDIYTIGHVLFWHSQTPDWVFEDAAGNPLSREALLARMRERVQLYADRYGDKVELWDVVNESIESDGTKRRSKFNQILGDEFEAEAFKMADEIMPKSAFYRVVKLALEAK